MVTYTDEDFLAASQVNIEGLQFLIEAELVTPVIGITSSEDGGGFTVEINFDGTPSSEELAALDAIVAAYEYHEYADSVVYIKDSKSPGTNGGTFTAGTWQTRTLNTLVGDAIFAAVDTNQITLQAGQYELSAIVPACDVKNHQARLRNVTDSTYVMGSGSYSDGGVVTTSTITTTLKLEASKVFTIQHICVGTVEGYGYGKSTGFNTEEVYTFVAIKRI